MRYVLVTGSLIITFAAGSAIFRASTAAGQQPVNRFLTAPPGAAGHAVVQYGQPHDEQSDETAKLNARDAELGQEAESLVKQLADATDDKQRDSIKDKLQETLAQQFDTQQKVRELEVTRIEAKVKKLRDVISKRNDARRSIIEKRLDQLIREAEGLGWNSPTGSPAYGAVYLPQPSAPLYPPASLPNPPREVPGPSKR
jgi:hypothetical protein